MTDFSNPRHRLALRTPSQESVPTRQNGFTTTVYGIFNCCITDSSCNC